MNSVPAKLVRPQDYPQEEALPQSQFSLAERPGEQDVASVSQQESHIPAARHHKNWSTALQHGNNNPAPQGMSYPNITVFVTPRPTNRLC